MKTSATIIFSLLLLSSVTLINPTYAQNTDSTAEELEPVMCPMDVMQCSDGTFVGRTGPACEFVCPTTTTLSEEPIVINDPQEGGGTNEPNQDRLRASDTAPAGEATRVERGENQEIRQELRTERRAALSDIRQQRIINLAANISNRMDAAVARLFAIVGRLESRIAKLESTGVDTSSARSALQAGSQSLAEARILLGDIDQAVALSTTSEEPYVAWQELRLRYQSIAAHIRDAHTSLRTCIAALTTPPSSDTETSSAPDNSAGPLLPTL